MGKDKPSGRGCRLRGPLGRVRGGFASTQPIFAARAEKPSSAPLGHLLPEGLSLPTNHVAKEFRIYLLSSGSSPQRRTARSHGGHGGSARWRGRGEPRRHPRARGWVLGLRHLKFQILPLSVSNDGNGRRSPRPKPSAGLKRRLATALSNAPILRALRDYVRSAVAVNLRGEGE